MNFKRPSNTLVYFLFILLIGCDIPNRELVLINNTPKRVHYRIYFDTLSVKSYYWHIGDCVEPYDTVQPHTVFGGKGALEFAMKSRSSDNCLFFYYTTNNIKNESNLDSIVKKRDYRMLKFSISDLKSLSWTINLTE
jgi:hypothetical protein